MERTIVLENLDEPSATWLEEEAQRLGLSIDQVIVQLIRQAIRETHPQADRDLDDLTGAWSDQETREFLDIVTEMDLVIPSEWLDELSADPGELRQALMLGLAQLRKQRQAQEIARQAVEVLLSTGRARRLPALLEDDEPPSPRRRPLKLPGMPVSEILIAQRRGES